MSDFRCCFCSATLPDQESLALHLITHHLPFSPMSGPETENVLRQAILLTMLGSVPTASSTSLQTSAVASSSSEASANVARYVHSSSDRSSTSTSAALPADLPSTSKLPDEPGGSRCVSVCSQDSSARERTHRCDECDKSFYQKRTLIAHQRIHTGEKPFMCHLCAACFRQAAHRNYHIKTHDPTYRPHVCSTCGRAFARKYSLSVHNYIHAGVFPFQCSICGKKFRQSADMRRHEVRHNKDRQQRGPEEKPPGDQA